MKQSRKLSFTEKIGFLFKDLYVSKTGTAIVSVDDRVTTEHYLTTAMNIRAATKKTIYEQSAELVRLDTFRKDAISMSKNMSEMCIKDKDELKAIIRELESYKGLKEKNDKLRKDKHKLYVEIDKLELKQGKETYRYRTEIKKLKEEIKILEEYDYNDSKLDLQSLSKHITGRKFITLRKIMKAMVTEIETLNATVVKLKEYNKSNVSVNCKENIAKLISKVKNERQLTCDEVKDAKSKKSKGMSYKDIAEIYNVSRSTISKAIRGKTYKDCK